MSFGERDGVWCWRILGAVVAVVLYMYVVHPIARASFNAILEEFAQEDREP